MQTIVELPVVTEPRAVHYPVIETVLREKAVPATEPNKTQQASLEALTIFHHATTDLLLRYLRLSKNSKRHLEKHLGALYSPNEQERYIHRLTPAKQLRYGSAPYVFTLARRGHNLLKQQGHAVGRYRATDQSLHKGRPLEHRLAVNEFLLKAFLLEDYPGVFLREHMHEKAWAAEPLRFTMTTDTGTDEAASISPDLLLDFQIDQPKKHYRFLPEINLTDPGQKTWRHKVRAYLYSLPTYKERFGTTLLTAVPLLVASADDFPRRDLTRLTPLDRQNRQLEQRRRNKRRDDFLLWTEAELTKLSAQNFADMFMFTSAPLDEINAFDLFFAPLWTIPFDTTPRPLMQYRGGDDGS